MSSGSRSTSDAVQVPLPEAREEQRGLAQGLRGERAGVDGGAARLGLPLDDRDALAEIRGLRGALLARGAAADDDEVVVAIHAVSLERWTSFRRPSGTAARRLGSRGLVQSPREALRPPDDTRPAVHRRSPSIPGAPFGSDRSRGGSADGTDSPEAAMRRWRARTAASRRGGSRSGRCWERLRATRRCTGGRAERASGRSVLPRRRDRDRGRPCVRRAVRPPRGCAR